MLIIIVSNVLGVVAIPFWLQVLMRGSASGVATLNVAFLDILAKLLLSVLAPTLVGAAVRTIVPRAHTFQAAHTRSLSMLSAANLACIIWQTTSSGRDLIVNLSSGTMLLVVLSTAAVNAFYLAFSATVVIALRVPLAEAIPVALLSSQKSPPIAISVVAYIAQGRSSAGLLALPAVVGQLVQIFTGQALAHHMAGVVSRRRECAASPKPADSNGKVLLPRTGSL